MVTNLLQLLTSEKSFVLTDVKNKLPSPLPEIQKYDNPLLEKYIPDEEPSIAEHSDDYFNFFDSSVVFFDEDKEEENYETFNDGLVSYEVIDPPYSLIQSNTIQNIFVASTRFVEDIIFTLINSKILEYSGLGLSAGIIASLLLLPSGFNVALPLLLSAPLFVCICGVLAKYLKQKTK